jgi:DNA primase
MTVEEMTDTLARLGVEVVDNRGDEIQGYCPAHEDRTGKADRNPSWWINADSGAHNCFSCGWKGNLFTLISYVEEIEYSAVNDWLGSTSSLTARFERLQKKPKQQEALEELTTVTESMLSAYTQVPSYALEARGLTSNAARYYGLLWDERADNWIIPIRDPITNNLLGWQEKGHTKRHFNNKPTKVKKSISLFGYEHYKGGDMIVVESPLDVVRLASLGVEGGVATYGALVSTTQFNLMRGAGRLIIAMDNDEAGRASSKELLRMCQELGVECWFFYYGNIDVKDVGGMSKAEVLEGLSKAKHLIRGEKAMR